MRNIRLIVQYEGTAYNGWQRQKGQPSVQQTLEEALEPINGGAVRLTGAGRTDAGVHAAGQAANFHTLAGHPPDAFMRAANARLPADVAVIEAAEAPMNFDARRSARQRWYRYRIHCGRVRPVFGRNTTLHARGPVNEERALQASRLFVGRHDFSAFRSALCTARRTLLDLEECSIRREADFWSFDFRCRSFLHNMVRILTGGILAVARSRLDLGALEDALESGERNPRIPTAPPQGLTLMGVFYPPGALKLDFPD